MTIAITQLGSMEYLNEPIFPLVTGGRAYFCNGYEPMKRYDHKSRLLAEAGLQAPTSNPTATGVSGSPGNLTGDFEYRMTEYDAVHDIESDVGSAINVTDLVLEDVDFSSFPTARNTRTTHFRIYRTQNFSGSTTTYPALYRVLEVSASAPGTPTDTITDTALLDEDPMPTLNGAPPVFRFPVYCKGRLFGWGQMPYDIGEVDTTGTSGNQQIPQVSDCKWSRGILGHRIVIDNAWVSYEVTDYDETTGIITLADAPTYAGPASASTDYHTFAVEGRLVWSAEDEPEEFPAANERYLARGIGERASGAAELNGSVFCFTPSMTVALHYEDDPSEGYGTEHMLSDDIGTVSHRTICKVHTSRGVALAWVSQRGIATTYGGPISIVSDAPAYPGGMRTYFERLRLDSTGANQMNCAVNYKSKKFYICAIETVNSQYGGCDEVLVWDYELNNFWIWDFKFEVMSLRIVYKFDADGKRKEVVAIGTHEGDTVYWPAGECDLGERDDDQTGTVSGTVTSATATTLTDTSATFLTRAGFSPPEYYGLRNARVTVYRASTGAIQHQRILENAGSELTVASWDWTPIAGDLYWVGEIHSYYKTPRMDFGSMIGLKRLRDVHVTHTVESAGELDLNFYKGQSATATSMSDGSKVYLNGAQSVIYEAARVIAGRQKFPVNQRGYNHQLEFTNRRANWPWEVLGVAMSVEMVRDD